MSCGTINNAKLWKSCPDSALASGAHHTLAHAMTKLSHRFGAKRFAADEYYARALQAYQAQRLPEAQEHIESAIELLPNHAEYLAMQGWIHLEGDETGAAKAAFDLALQANPYEMLANYGKGMLAYREKSWDSAAGCFLNALAASPDRPEIQYYLALVRHRQGENAQALQWMDAAKTIFAKASDDREERCHAWLREFEKLLPQAMSPKP